MVSIIVFIAGPSGGHALAAQINIECFIANKRVVAHLDFNPAQVRWHFPQAAINADRGIFANTTLDALVKQALKVLRQPLIKPYFVATLAVTLCGALPFKRTMCLLVIALFDPLPEPAIELFKRSDFIKNQRLLKTHLQGQEKALNLSFGPTVVWFGFEQSR